MDPEPSNEDDPAPPPPPTPSIAYQLSGRGGAPQDGRDTPAPSLPQHSETRLGLAARRAAQLPKLRDLSKRNRQESLDDPSSNEPDLDFQYGDSDTFVQELSELYSYSERDEFIDNYRSFLVLAERRSIFKWAPFSTSVKTNFIMSLLEELELSDADRRRNALQAMAYLLQGNFMDVTLAHGEESEKKTTAADDVAKNRQRRGSGKGGDQSSTESQCQHSCPKEAAQCEESFVLRNLCDNAFLLYELGAWPALCMILTFELENAPNSTKMADSTGRRPSLTSADCRMLRLALACMFTILEVMRRVDDEENQQDGGDRSASSTDSATRHSPMGFSSKLSPAEMARRRTLKESLIVELGQPINGTDQTLSALLFDMTTKCCSGAAPHYPMRKTLLLLWKTVLMWLGGWNELKEMKNEARRKAGLLPCEDTLTVASMMQAAPPPQLPLYLGGGGAIGMNDDSNHELGSSGMTRRPPLAKRQLACAPSDGDDMLDEDEVANSTAIAPTNESTTAPSNDVPDAAAERNPAGATDLGTPMPSRAQSPDPNGQGAAAPPAALPPPKLLPWTPKIRRKDIEQFLERERYKFFGFQLPEDGTTTAGLPAPIAESLETLKRHVYVSLSEKQIRREDTLAKYVFSQGAQEPDADETPAEELYRSMLPQIPQYIIGLLKILLAAAPTSKAKSDAINLMAEVLPANGGQDGGSTAANAANSIGKEQSDHGLITTVDINRHKEILVKSISALLILLLKHFKLNHVYQFEYVSQHLVFANCIPLILKFFDQNILQYVQKANELKQLNFPYCVIEYAKLERESSPSNNNHSAAANDPNAISKSTTMIACGADFLLGTSSTSSSSAYHQQQQQQQQNSSSQTEYMWRNLFSAVNLLRILNKLTKWKHARTMMLVVFKSAPVLKRSLRVKHILLQLYALKLLKMQAKYLGRQWRKTNMELMSAIYSKVRHRLNDDWAYGNETQAKPWDFQSEEAALRNAVEKFNMRRYGNALSLAIDGDLTSGLGQNRFRCGSPLDSNGSQNEGDGHGEREPFVFDAKDPEYQPFDSYVVSVLGVKYELTDQFKFNCERWIDREVLKAKIDWDQLLKRNV